VLGALLMAAGLVAGALTARRVQTCPVCGWDGVEVDPDVDPERMEPEVDYDQIREWMDIWGPKLTADIHWPDDDAGERLDGTS
jgi:hypothetical protein